MLRATIVPLGFADSHRSDGSTCVRYALFPKRSVDRLSRSKGMGRMRAWGSNRRSSGLIRPSIRGSVARKWLERGEPLLRATSAMRKNGRSEVVKFSGAIIRGAARPSRIGAPRCSGTVERGRFRVSTDGGSACFAHPSQTCSTIKSIHCGEPICSSSSVNVTSWIGSF
jgi:hypothetical protein